VIAIVVAISAELGAVGACGDAASSPRDRVLATLPAGASFLAVGDGASLIALKAVVDELRPSAPPSLGCVIDAALASTQAGVAFGSNGVTVALATDVAPTGCPALSQLASGVWVATVGGGEVAADRADAPSALVDAHLSRARDYLRAAPIAVAGDVPGLGAHIIGTATAAPLEAWLALDFADATLAAKLADSLRSGASELAHVLGGKVLAGRIAVNLVGQQVVIQLARGDATIPLAGVTRAIASPLLVALNTPAAPSTWRLGCPTGRAVTRCEQRVAGIALELDDFAELASELVSAELQPVVVGGQIMGVRVGPAGVASLGLATGDVLIARDGRPIQRGLDVVHALGSPSRTSLLVRRGSSEQQIVISPH
jgi:hypothetical protein